MDSSVCGPFNVFQVVSQNSFKCEVKLPAVRGLVSQHSGKCVLSTFT